MTIGGEWVPLSTKVPQIVEPEPLRNEFKSLENRADEKKRRGEETTALIAQLERSIASYKEEYAQLISQAQAIKLRLETVQGKVDRSIALLKSLTIREGALCCRQLSLLTPATSKLFFRRVPPDMCSRVTSPSSSPSLAARCRVSASIQFSKRSDLTLIRSVRISSNFKVIPIN